MTYRRFLAMIATSTLIMYGLMYLNTYETGHIWMSETRAWMALLMGAVMALIMLGFMFAWIAGVVAEEDVEVKTGVLILFLTGVVTVLVRIIVSEVDGIPMPGLIGAAANFLALIVMTHAFAKIEWKKSALIAIIYTVILFLINLVCVNVAGIVTFLVQGLPPRSWRLTGSILMLWALILFLLASMAAGRLLFGLGSLDLIMPRLIGGA